jgi:ABC-type nitrate/sulfonate/bicarbonate transport system ATPase subunit
LRAAIDRAFAVRPDFLLLDEPFVALDEALAMRLREELTALTRREKVTTWLVTHDLDEAIELADHLFFLSSRPTRVILERRLTSPASATNCANWCCKPISPRAMISPARCAGWTA